jgi:hypothetical protein
MPSSATPEGMQIDERDEHREKAQFPMDESREPDSNVTVERAEHSAKHFVSIRSTRNGMQIEESDEHLQNVQLSRRDMLEPDSNTTSEMARLSAKHPASSVSIVFAIVTSVAFPMIA